MQSDTLKSSGNPIAESPVAWARVALLALAFVACFWHFLRNQGLYSLDPDWSHAFVVPVISIYFIFENRRRIMAIPTRTAWVGIVPLVLGILLYLFSSLVEAFVNHLVQGVGVMFALMGLVLLTVGWKMWKALLFPQLYLVLAIKLPPSLLGLITPTLQRLAAQGAFLLLQLAGYDGDIEGNIITIVHEGQSIPLNVAEACSGMRMVVAFVALGVAVAAFGVPRWWQRVLLVAMALPVAVFINILRVATIGFMSTKDVGWARGDAHMFLGLLWLVPAVLLYMGIAWVLNNLFIDDQRSQAMGNPRSTTPKGVAL